MVTVAEKSVEELDAQYKQLSQKRETLTTAKVQIEAELNARKRILKEVMEDCKKAEVNPDNIQEDLRRMTEVLHIKMDNYAAEIDAAEAIMKPMLKELAG